MQARNTGAPVRARVSPAEDQGSATRCARKRLALPHLLWACMVLCMTSVHPRAFGQSGQERIPLDENFSQQEQLFIWGTSGLAGALLYFQSDLLKWTVHDPWIGAPAPWEVAISDSLYQGADYQLMNGFPDTFGEKVAPYVALGWYTGNSVLLGLQGKSLTGNVNADHEAFAFMEAYGLNLAFTQLTKITVRRLRPFWALERDVSVQTEEDSYLSFFSGHSSSSFCIAAFVARDLSDALVSGPLANASVPLQVGLGRVVPGVALYGLAALIAYSRVVDQQHFLTDVLVGSLVGATLGNLAYARHFDWNGTPRRSASASARTQTRLYAGPLQLSLQVRW